jgi:predicted aspartyl protease
MNVNQLLEQVAGRIGGAERLRQIRTARYSGQIQIGSLAGPFQLDRETATGRYRNSMDLRAFRSISGFDGEQLWRVDANGKVSTSRDNEAIAEAVISEKLDDDQFLIHPEEYEFSVSESESEYIVEITSREYRDQLFGSMKIHIDRETLLITRKEAIRGGYKVTTMIGDYRKFDGLLFAREIRTLDAVGNESIVRIHEIEINQPVDDPALFLPPSDDVRDFSFLNNGHSAVIPIRIPVDHIYTDVRIDGRTYQFIVDTGASSTVLSTALAAELGLESLGTVIGGGVSGSQELSFVEVPEMIVGDISLVNQRIIAMDFSELQKKIPSLDGILGMDFLNRFVIRLDYVKGEMEAFDLEHFSYDGSGEQFDLDGIYCFLSFDGHSGKFTIDTGAGGFSLHAPFVRKYDLIRDRERMPSASSIAGLGSTELRVYEALCHEINLGSFTLHDIPVHLSEIETGAFANEAIVGNVGGMIWRKFIVYFDFTANRMILEPNTNFDEPFPLNRLGMGFKQIGSRYLVDSVATHSPASELGVGRDDELLEFDGVPATAYSLDDLRLKFRAEEGTRYRMKFLTTEGSEREHEVTLRKYLRYYDDY